MDPVAPVTEALTMIAAPALLTNATCILAAGTVSRMLRTHDAMRDLLEQSAKLELRAQDRSKLVDQARRVERQGEVLLGALRCVYVALGAFSGATLLMLFAAGLLKARWEGLFQSLARITLVVVAVGVGSLVLGSVRLFHATRLSLADMRDEASTIRERLQTEPESPLG
jgi:hypothetical protein